MGMEMEKKILLIVLVTLGVILLMLLVRWLRPRERFPYEPRPLLTPREQAFYFVLESICQRNGWKLLVKLRLADIVAVRKGTEGYMSYFNRVKAKHTDFVICDPETMEILAGVELDDPSHIREDRAERDEFVDRVYEAAGIPLIHVWMEAEEEQLEAQLLQELRLLDEDAEPVDEEEDGIIIHGYLGENEKSE